MRAPRVGLLVLYVPFYEGIVATLSEKQAFEEELRTQLSKSCSVLSPGLVDSEEKAVAAAELFSTESVDAVVIVPAIAVFGALGWCALERVDVPVCIWNVQPAAGIPESYNIAELIRNSGGLGVQALANTMARAGKAFRVTFSRQGEAIPAALTTFLKASVLSKDLLRARFGRIGSVFAQMTDVAMSPAQWPGEAIVEVPASELHARYRQQLDDLIQIRTRMIHDRHTVSDLGDDELSRSARLWLTLDEIVSEHGLSGGAFNCHGENCLRNSEIGVVACYAVSAQTSSGRPFSCTGDLPTAIAMWLLDQLAGSVIYGELDLVDPEANCVLLANGGEGHFAAAQGPVSVIGNENFAGLHGRGAALNFAPFSGPATLASFTPLDPPKRYRLIIAEGEMLNMRLPNLKVFHGAFRFDGLAARDAFERWCEAGAVHHVAIAPGKWAPELAMAARNCDFEFVNLRGEP